MVMAATGHEFTVKCIQFSRVRCKYDKPSRKGGITFLFVKAKKQRPLSSKTGAAIQGIAVQYGRLFVLSVVGTWLRYVDELGMRLLGLELGLWKDLPYVRGWMTQMFAKQN